MDFPTFQEFDKDKTYICPYNKHHVITAKIYPLHLAKCRRQYTGKAFKICPFNTRHEIPAPEFEYHLHSCPDKFVMEKECRQSSVTNVVPVTYDQNTFSSAEDWEEETTSTTFSLWEDNNENPFAVVEAYQDNLLVNIEQKKPMKSTSGLTKTQKKNEKRAEKRREKNAANASSEHENYNDRHDNNENGSLDDEDTLGKMAREYSPPGRVYSSNSAFVDWVSILNIYCQKHKINQPQYKEDKTRFGGFGYCVTVGVKKFWTGSYCSTKKDAKHSAARSALLGLEVSVSTPDPCRAPHMASDYERAQQLAQNAQILQSKTSSQNRIIPGHNPTNVQTSQSDISKTIATTESKLKQVVIKEEKEDDGWQVAGRKRATNQDYLKLAGMGRGRGRHWRS